MRSPWQLIKGFASRRRSDEGGASIDEAVPTSDPQVEAFENPHAPHRERETGPITGAHPKARGNETAQRLPSIEADARQPKPAIHPSPMPSQVAEKVARKGLVQPAQEAAAVVTIEGNGNVGARTAGPNERRAKVPRARENVRTRTVGHPLRTAYNGE